MIKTVLEAAGKKAGLIGTTGVVIGEHVTPTMNTTPESYELHKAFAQMAEAGCDYAVMEVSSQGVKMHRVDGILFDYSIFTNISQTISGRMSIRILRSICIIKHVSLTAAALAF